MLQVKKHRSEWIFQTVLAAIMIMFSVLMIYPFLNIFAKSLSTGSAMIGKTVYILPVSPTLNNYWAIFNNSLLIQSLLVSVARTVVGTMFHLVITGAAAYACSKKRLKGRYFLTVFFLIPMYFGGGLLPGYILITKLGLMNSFWVYIFPGMFSTFNFLVMMTYFRQLPESIEESARIDGANDFQIFTRIVIPVSTPIIATIALLVAVGHWNSWFDAVLYVNTAKLQPVQAVLQQIIQGTQTTTLLRNAQYGTTSANTNTFTTQSITMATLCFTVFPILFVYPFLQKYFVKGIMIGGVKG